MQYADYYLLQDLVRDFKSTKAEILEATIQEFISDLDEQGLLK